MNEIKRATTCPIEISLPFDYKDFVTRVLITFKQFDNIIIEKTENDISYNGNVITYHLTQEETKMFKPNVQAKVQARILTIDNEALATDEVYFMPRDVLNDEVLV